MVVRAFTACLCLLGSAGFVVAQSRPADSYAAYDRYLAAEIRLGSINRGEDLTLSPDGKRAWICLSLARTVVCFDATTGRILGTFGNLNNPFVIHCRQSDKRLYVVDEAKRSGGGGAVIRVFDTETGRQIRSVTVDDWRLYRVAAAAFSKDGKWAWLVSQPCDSSCYGHVPPALFRVDLKTGTWKQIGGPPPPTKPPLSGNNTGLRNWKDRHHIALTLDAGGRLLATPDKQNVLRAYPSGKTKPTESLQLDFKILRLQFLKPGRVAAIGESRVAIIDTKRMKAIARSSFSGLPTIACADAAGREIFIALKSKILRFNVARGRFDRPIPLPTKYPNSFREVVAIRWTDKPERLVGLGGGGGCPFIYDLRKGTFQRITSVRHPGNVILSPDGNLAYVCCDSGCLSVADLRANRCVGTIPVGGKPVDVAFFGKNKAVISDESGKRLVVMDMAKLKVLARIPLRDLPWCVVVTKDGKTAAVTLPAEREDRYAIVDLRSQKVRYVEASALPKELRGIIDRKPWGHKKVDPKTGRGVRLHSSGKDTLTLYLGGDQKQGVLVPLFNDIGGAVVGSGPQGDFAYVSCSCYGSSRVTLLKFRLHALPQRRAKGK